MSQRLCGISSLHNMQNSSNENSTTSIILELIKFKDAYRPLHSYISMILCAFGLCTNVLNFVVLTRSTMKTSTNLILATISVCDICKMLSYICFVAHFYIGKTHAKCQLELYTYKWMIFVLFHSVWSVYLHSLGLWLSVLMAAMRYSVMNRLKCGYQFLQPNNVWKWILFVCLVLVVACVPLMLAQDVFEYPNSTTSCQQQQQRKLQQQQQQPQQQQQNDSNKDIFFKAYVVRYSILSLKQNCLLLRTTLWINGVAFKLVPCVLLAVAIYGLYRVLNKAKHRKSRLLCKSLSSNKPYEEQLSSRTTSMLVAILSVFVITELPQAIMVFFSGIYVEDLYFTVYPQIGDVLDLLSLINSDVNFVLYCTMSSRFRSTFSELFLPKRFLPSVYSQSDNIDTAWSRGQPSGSFLSVIGMNQRSSHRPSADSASVVYLKLLKSNSLTCEPATPEVGGAGGLNVL